MGLCEFSVRAQSGVLTIPVQYYVANARLLHLWFGVASVPKRTKRLSVSVLSFAQFCTVGLSV